MREILHEALSLLENGEPFALVTLVAQQGSTPRAAGAQMLVRRDGSIAGTIGGGLLEATMMREAAEAIAAGRSQVSAVELTGQSVSGPTMICGGHAAVLVAFVPAGDVGLRTLLGALSGARADGRAAWLYTFFAAEPGPTAVSYRLLQDGAEPLGELPCAPIRSRPRECPEQSAQADIAGRNKGDEHGRMPPADHGRPRDRLPRELHGAHVRPAGGDGLRRLPHHRRFEQPAADGPGDGAASPHEHLRPRGPRRGAPLRDERDQGERLAVLKQAQRLVQDLTHGSAGRRQPHRELRPALRAIGGLDDAALGLDETAGDGETEADALRAPRRLRAVEAVEDEGQVDGIDAGTAVGDRQGRPGAAGR